MFCQWQDIHDLTRLTREIIRHTMSLFVLETSVLVVATLLIVQFDEKYSRDSISRGWERI
jgi:hypothetical protein